MQLAAAKEQLVEAMEELGARDRELAEVRVVVRASRRKQHTISGARSTSHGVHVWLVHQQTCHLDICRSAAPWPATRARCSSLAAR